MRAIPVIMIMLGIILIWAAITNHNPIKVVQNVLQGEDALEDAELPSNEAPTDPLEQTPANPGPDGEFPLAPGEDFEGPPPLVA
jgi:hypothetical protein